MPTYGLRWSELKSRKNRKKKLPRAITARTSPPSEIGLRNHSRKRESPVLWRNWNSGLSLVTLNLPAHTLDFSIHSLADLTIAFAGSSIHLVVGFIRGLETRPLHRAPRLSRRERRSLSHRACSRPKALGWHSRELPRVESRSRAHVLRSSVRT